MTIFKARLGLGASALALAAAAPFLAGVWVEHTVRAELGAQGIEAKTISVSLAGKVDLRQVRTTNGSFTVERVSYSTTGWTVFAAAQAQAGGYSFTNLSGNIGPVKIEVPSIEIAGASVGKDDLGKTFAFDAGLPARLKSLSIKSVSIPEMKATLEIPGGTDNFSYVFKNITADDTVNGKVGRMAVANTSFSAKMKDGNQKGQILKHEIKNLDLAQSARIYYDTAAPGEKSAPLYTSYVLDGMTNSVSSAAAVEMEMGKVTQGEFRMRPMKGKSLATFVSEAMKLAEESKGKSSPPPAALGEMFGQIADMLEGMEEDEGMVMRGTRITVGEKAQPIATLLIDKIEGAIGTPQKPAGFKLTGIDVKAPDVTAKLASYSIEGFSYIPMLKGMAEAVRNGDPDFKNVDPRLLMPRLGTTALTGLEIDAPAPKSPKGAKPERVNVKLGKFLVALNDQVKGVPTNIDFTIEKLAVKLPENSADDAIKQLKALGYSALDMSARIAAKWNEQSKDIAISEITVSGENMGKVKLTGNLGNIGREVFEGDLSMAQVALMGATAKAVSLQIDNAGLGEKLLAMQARQQNRKPEELRKELGQAAQLGIPAILGPSDDAKSIANALAKFVTQMKSLTIDVKSKNAGGVGIPDIATVGSPDKALGLVSVQASAN